jgi:hypothetical protein
VARQLKGVSIIGQGRDTLGGKKGGVPVSVDNRLGYPVRVRIQLHVSQTAGGGFSVVPSSGVHQVDADTVITGVIQVPAGNLITKKIQVSADTVGTTTISMRLLTPSGRVLPGHVATMQVQATHFGTFALVILAAALGVFMITSAARAIRRGRNPSADSAGRPEPADEDGQEESAEENAQVEQDAPRGSSGAGHEQPEGTDNVGRDRARSDAAGTDHVLTEDADDYARVPGWADRS